MPKTKLLALAVLLTAACRDAETKPAAPVGHVQLPAGEADTVEVHAVERPEARRAPLPVAGGRFALDAADAKVGQLTVLDVKRAGVRVGYLVADGQQLATGVHVTILSEYASRRLDDYLEVVPTARFEHFQDRIAQSLVRDDLDGDGVVDHRDLLAFDPEQPSHLATLSFDYHEALDRPLACACTLRESYARPTDARELEARLAEVFDPLVDVDLPNADAPPSLRSVNVDVDHGGSIRIDELPEVVLDATSRQLAYRVEDEDHPTTLTLHATPAESYRFVRWVGCDEPRGETCVMHASVDAPGVSAQFGVAPKEKDGVALVRLADFAAEPVASATTPEGLDITVPEGGAADAALAKVAAGGLVASDRAGLSLALVTAVTTTREPAGDHRVRYVFAATQAAPTAAYEQVSAFEPDREADVDDVESVTITDSPGSDPAAKGASLEPAVKRVIDEPVWLVGHGRAFELGHGLFLTRVPGKSGLSLVRAVGEPREVHDAREVPLRDAKTEACTILGGVVSGCLLPAVKISRTWKKILEVKLEVEAALEVKSTSSVTFAAPYYMAFETRGKVHLAVGAKLAVGIAAKGEAFASCRTGSGEPAKLPAYDTVPDALNEARIEDDDFDLLADDAAADEATRKCSTAKKTSLDAKKNAEKVEAEVKEVTVQLNKGTPEGIAFPISAGFKIGLEAKGHLGVKINYIVDTTTAWDAGFEIGKRCSGLFSCDDFKSTASGRTRTTSGQKVSMSVGANGVIAPYVTLGLYAGVRGVKEDFLKLEGKLAFPFKLAGHAGGIEYSSLPLDRAAGGGGWCVKNKAGLVVGVDLEASFGLTFDAKIKKSVLGWDVEFGGSYDVFKIVKTVPLLDETPILSTRYKTDAACTSLDNTPVDALPAELAWGAGDLDWVDPGTIKLTKTHQLELQPDGNLVLSRLVRGAGGRITGRVALWSSGTEGRYGSRATFQKDGNLVVYDLRERPVFASGSYGKNAAQLRLQADGNLVVYDAQGAALWASATNGK